MIWAQRLKRVFNIDVSVCPKRCGEARVIACIKDQAVVDAVLDQLMKKGVLPLHPPVLSIDIQGGVYSPYTFVENLTMMGK